MKKLIILLVVILSGMAITVQGQTPKITLDYVKSKKIVQILPIGSLLLNKPNQDTVKKFTKIVDFGKPTQIKYECVVLSNGDTVCKEQGKGFTQGYKEQTDSTKTEFTVQEQKLLELVKQLNKIENDITKFVIDNGGQELLNTKQQIIGV